MKVGLIIISQKLNKYEKHVNTKTMWIKPKLCLSTDLLFAGGVL